MKSGSSAAERDAVFGTAESGEFLFKGLDFMALNECGLLADAVESGKNFISELGVFRFEVQKGYFHLCAAPAVRIKTVLHGSRLHKPHGGCE